MFEFRCNLSCFAPERQHKTSKWFASTTYKDLPRTLIARTLNCFMIAISDPHAFEAVHLCHPIADATDLCDLFSLYGVPVQVTSSKALSSTRGDFRRGDAMLWRDPASARIEFGLVQLCVRVQFQGADSANYSIFVHGLQSVGRDAFTNRNAISVLVSCQVAIKAVPFQREGDFYKLLVPRFG